MSDTFANEMSKLQADVTAQSTVIASATAAFQGLAAQLSAVEAELSAAGVTPEQVASLTAVRTALEANSAALAAAIPANTPAVSTGATGATGAAMGATAATDATA